MKTCFDFVWGTAAVCCCCFILHGPANGQTSRERKRNEDAPSKKVLEVRLEKAEAALVDEYKDVAVEFYKQGNKEKSMQMLRRLRQLHPKLEGLKDRIESISEELMQENPSEIEIDTRKTWEFVGDVAEEKAFRVAAKGEFKLTISATVSVDGLAIEEDATDFLPSAPIGCLLGVIVTDGKPGKIFPVKSALEHTPKKSGKLFVKVNVPEGTRCSGTLKLRVSGYINSGKPSKKK